MSCLNPRSKNSTILKSHKHKGIVNIKESGARDILNRGYDGSKQKIFINGELSESLSAAFSPFTPSSPESITIGTGIVSGGEYGEGIPRQVKNGLIDDLRIYNRALSESEIQNLYNAAF